MYEVTMSVLSVIVDMYFNHLHFMIHHVQLFLIMDKTFSNASVININVIGLLQLLIYIFLTSLYLFLFVLIHKTVRD